MKTKLLFGMLTAATALAVAPAVFADEGSVEVKYDYSTPYLRGEIEDGSFTAIHISVDGTVGNYTLTGNGEEAITNQNVYITGSGEDGSSLTITATNIDNGTHSGAHSGLYAFIVEGATVTFDGGTDGLVVSELGMNLCIGTMEDATLNIINGASVTTGAYWNTIGSNLATATVNITGSGSLLDTQQINIGMATTSLSGMTSDPTQDGYYYTQYLEDDDAYNNVVSTLTGDEYTPTDGSYGIINVTQGGTWQVGVGNTDTSDNRLQFSNGVINIDGEGSSLVFGNKSSLVMENMTSSITGIKVSETINVTNGGSVKAAEGVTLHEIVIGQIYSGSNGEAAIYVDGEGSTFDLSDNGDVSLYIGEKYETVAGGTEKVTISASKGGTLKLSSAYGINVGYTYASGSYQQAEQMSISLTAESGGTITLAAAENGATYSTYFGRNTATEKTSTIDVKATGEGSSVVISTNKTIYTNYNTSNFNTSFVAEKGGSLSLSSGSVVYFGYQTKGEGNNIKVTATGEDSTVNVSSGTNMYTSYEANYGNTTFTAEDGGSLTLAATTGYICLGYGSDIVGSTAVLADGGTVNLTGTQIVTNNNSAANFTVELTATNGGTMTLTTTSGISFSYNTAVTVEKGSTLTTVGGAYFGSGSSFSVDATSSWTGGSVTLDSGVTAAIGVAAVADGVNDVNVSLGKVTIAEGGSVYVVIDVSSLEDNTSTSVAVLTADSVTLNSETLLDGDVTSVATGYFTADENGYTVDSWSWEEGTLYVNVTTTPEPSMFGLFFGLGAIALTATRRRRA